MKKISLLPLITLNAIPVFITGCSNVHDPINIVKTLIKDNFNSNSPISLGTANDQKDAQEQLNKYFNDNEIKKNEILFDCFNFLGKKELEINGNQYTGANNSILDYLDNGKCEMSCQYNISFQDVSDNKFNFNFQGYVTIQYVSALHFNADSTISKGDWIQYVFDIEGQDTFCHLTTEEENEQFNVNISYSLPITPSSSSSFSYIYGFIKGVHNSKDIQTMAINNMDDIRYASHPYVNAYYEKN